MKEIGDANLKSTHPTKHTLKICPRFNNIAKTLVTHSLSNMDPRDASASKNVRDLKNCEGYQKL